MRFSLLAFVPLVAACGSPVAFISGEDFPSPGEVGAVARPVRLPPQMMGTMTVAPPAAVPVFAMGELVLNTDGLHDIGAVVVPDTGVFEDAGVETDAGVSPDAGVEIDAGASPDTSTGFDAGVFEDAGVEPAKELDAGALLVVDAGTPVVIDAGTTAWDGGTNGLEASPHLALGFPDDSSVGATTKWLLVRPQYVVSYDTTRKTPRWSSWRLQTSDFGAATRATSFRTDPLLPTAVPQAKDADYVGSGFDRGHVCPSADRTATDADNDATFFLTNVVPQTHTSNAGPWLDLEDEARTIANTGKVLVIIAGPIFGATKQSIGTGVDVPLSMFKVAVVLDGPAAPGSVTTSTKVYAAIVPNASVLSGAWRTYQVTVDEVERQTGLDFLADVNPALQAVLEARVDP